MCRMIAAVGRFDAGSVLGALSEMAANANRAFDHELRNRGSQLRHDSGWGVVWTEGDALARRRSTRACFDDAEFSALPATAATLLVAHARRTKAPDTIAMENTHPFMATWRGTEYAFCHNGEVSDRSQLSWDGSLTPRGNIDSEELFLHTITRLDPPCLARSVESALGGLRDFTSLNCVLASRQCLIAYARRHPDSARPMYYTLWHGSGPELEIVSSEIVEGFDVDWRPVPQGAAVQIAVEPSSP